MLQSSRSIRHQPLRGAQNVAEESIRYAWPEALVNFGLGISGHDAIHSITSSARAEPRSLFIERGWRLNNWGVHFGPEGDIPLRMGASLLYAQKQTWADGYEEPKA